MCERYATSKLRRVEDLREISTFGFRGEALASISHVSRLSLLTRTADSPVGFRASFLDGKIVTPPEAVAANPGTILTVQDLFYNNPVRSAMIASATAKNEEYARIVEVLQRYAIAKAGACAFSCRKSNGVADLVTRLNQPTVDVIRAIHGEKIASALLPLEGPDGSFTGLVSNAYYQGKNFICIFFINGRLVESPRLRRALASVYGQLLLKGTHPFVYLSLSLPPDRVDVNVHPTKREVVFLDEDLIVHKVTDALGSVLSQSGIVAASPFPITRAPPSLPAATLKSVQDVRMDHASVTFNSQLRPKAPKYPFQQIHTDPRTRTLDFFAHKRARHADPKDEPRVQATVSQLASSISNSTGDLRTDHPFLEPSTLQASVSERDISTKEPTSSPSDEAMLKLRSDSWREGSKKINDILQRHSFVGLLDERQVFIQYESALLLLDIPRVLWSYFYLCIVYSGRCKLPRKQLPSAISIAACLQAFFASPRSTLLDADSSLDRKQLHEELCTFYRTNDRARNALEDLLAVQVDNDAMVRSLYDPLAIASGDAARLGEYLFRLVIQIDWDHVSAVELSDQLIRLYCEYLVGHLTDTAEKRELYEFVLLDAARRPPPDSLYPRDLLSNGAIVQVATTHELYKIFERC